MWLNFYVFNFLKFDYIRSDKIIYKKIFNIYKCFIRDFVYNINIYHNYTLLLKRKLTNL